MPVPEGYTKLGIIGFVDKGEYLNDATYMSGDVVFYNGSTYKVIKDNLSGVTPSNDGKNYRYMAQGFSATEASGVTAIDTQDLTGVGKGKKSTVQALLDKIAQKLVERVVTSDTFQTVLGKYLVNNGLTTEAGKFGLDAAFGKNLQDQITQQNSNMSDIPKQYAALDKENSFTQAQKIISDSIPALQIISGSTGTSKGTFQITARTDINPYSRAAIDLINNGQINGTLYLHEDGFLRWYAHGNTYKINVTQE